MSVATQRTRAPGTITTATSCADSLASYWIAQATLRLRREVCWCWHQRAGQSDTGVGILPPLTDAAAENLDLARYLSEKRDFFAGDPTAGYLSDEIAELQRPAGGDRIPGSWAWLADTLGLNEASQFVLALGLAARLDAALAPIFATCMNDLTRPYPTLALAQRLWDEPLAIVGCADPAHPLFRYGLLSHAGETAGGDWYMPLEMHGMLAAALQDPHSALPQTLKPLTIGQSCALDESGGLLAARLASSSGRNMQIVPLLGEKGSVFAAWAASLSRRLGRPAVALSGTVNGSHGLLSVASLCWLRGLDLLLPEHWFQTTRDERKLDQLLGVRGIPIRCYIPVTDRSQYRHLPDYLLCPPLKIKPLTFEQRVRCFERGLGKHAGKLRSTLEECARRFHFEERSILRLTGAFVENSGPPTASALITACRNESNTEFAGLAQMVAPRFRPDELVLPKQQALQFREITQAMGALTRVHYHWGMARSWNESGLAVLFCGLPGTGKTMAAEALSSALDLPMYRIDLSQVINKYIGETEKNLKRIFDAAELSDCILFFDEADALFGKRTEVKDAHDRFANIEISYLLERMERFKGLAVLATNRRKDLDEAFMRRLRYIIEFPLPGVKERERIWRQVFPEQVDVSELDLPYLATQFQLSGGHIRSIAFNACLQAAADSSDGPEAGASAKVDMKSALIAVKRELDKTNRASSIEVFGPYAPLIQGIFS